MHYSSVCRLCHLTSCSCSFIESGTRNNLFSVWHSTIIRVKKAFVCFADELCLQYRSSLHAVHPLRPSTFSTLNSSYIISHMNCQVLIHFSSPARCPILTAACSMNSVDYIVVTAYIIPCSASIQSSRRHHDQNDAGQQYVWMARLYIYVCAGSTPFVVLVYELIALLHACQKRDECDSLPEAYISIQ